MIIDKILDTKTSYGSREMRYILHKDGSFDLIGRQISLKNCYPGTEGAPLRPIRVETVKNVINYTLTQGTIKVCFEKDDEGRIAISSRASGAERIHDYSPLAEGQIDDTAQIYVQGFGMEGPSGMFPIGGEQHTSHGLTALFKDSEAVLLYTEDHTRYSASFRIEQKNTLLNCCPVLSAVINFEGTVGTEWEAPVLYLEEAAGGESALRHCASRIAAAMHARRTKPPAFFWSSWYYAYETMDDAMLENILSGIRKESIPFQFVELDAGYTVSIGDWLQTNSRWPKGLADAASKIRSAGLEPGIWIAPFIVGDRSQLFRSHPDWMLSGPDGKPLVRLRSYTEPKIWGNPDCDYYVLDASHPEALAYIKEVFTTLRSWGFSMFKTDFMLWNMYDSALVRRYDPNKTSVEIMRTVLAEIRSAIGEDSYLLGCIAPLMPFIGYADGMRLAGDCGAQWADTYGPVNLLQEIPCGNYFNHLFWQNDPDAMLLRDFDTMLKPEEVWSLALLQALSGGIVSTSDPVHLLGEDRKRLLRLVEPHDYVMPQYRCFGLNRKELIITHNLRQGSILFVMNPTEEPLTVVLKMSELFGKDCKWHTGHLDITGSWNSDQEDLVVETIMPHQSKLMFITKEPLRSAPENLWIW